MITIKLIGGTIITLCSLKVYIEIQRFHQKKIKQLDSLILLIEYIKNQIVCYLLPIDKIIENCNKNLLKNCGIKTEVHNCKRIDEVLNLIDFYCNEEAIDILFEFAENFGHSYYFEQLKICEECKNKLIKIKDKTIEQNKKNQKVELAICLCISFSIIIMLI